MSYPSEVSVSQKSVYKRPYKTRSQRRSADRKKYDESSDRRFLLRVAAAITILLAVALGFLAKGMMERSTTEAATLPTTIQ